MTGTRLSRLTTSILLLLALILSSSSVIAGAARHKVRAGDTLWDIAARNHTTPKAIARANGIGENSTLALGKSLRIPGKVTKSRHNRKHVASRSDRWARHSAKHARYVKSVAPEQAVGNQGEQTSQSGEKALVQTALMCRGARYARGGTSRGGFDCSGFTRYVYAKYGVGLPHSSAAQAHLGTPVSKSELRAGDLVFFQTYRRGISHVGIYIGGGRFVHASTHGRGVTVNSLGDSYYLPRYRGARRVK